MPVVTLSKTLIDALKPSDKLVYYWDDVTLGLGVLVTPTGAKTYQVQYRFGGRAIRFQQGEHIEFHRGGQDGGLPVARRQIHQPPHRPSHRAPHICAAIRAVAPQPVPIVQAPGFGFQNNR